MNYGYNYSNANAWSLSAKTSMAATRDAITQGENAELRKSVGSAQTRRQRHQIAHKRPAAFRG